MNKTAHREILDDAKKQVQTAQSKVKALADIIYDRPQRIDAIATISQLVDINHALALAGTRLRELEE